MAQPIRSVLLEIDPALNIIKGDKKFCDGLSVAQQVGKYLWTANDETKRIDRFSTKDGSTYKDHTAFPLTEILGLPEEGEEVDIEELACQDGCLWLVGSHSLKREKPKKKGTDAERAASMTVKLEKNRYLSRAFHS